MRLTTIALCAFLCAAPAAAHLVDREAVFTRSREVAAATLKGVETADLVLFRIAYDLTLLETGSPEGTFEVALLAGAEFAYYYRTIRVRLPEQGDKPPFAEFSTLLLNRDPDARPAGVSSLLAPEPQPIERSTP